MKYLEGTTAVPNWVISVKKLWFRFKILMVVLLILEGIALYNNPVLLMKQGDAWNSYWDAKAKKNTRAYIKHKYGGTIANMYDSKNVWCDFGSSMNKSWRDTLVIFRGVN